MAPRGEGVMKSKRFIVLGLGSFGRTLALRLAENGCRVTGVDASEVHVESIQDRLDEAIIGDVTNPEVLQPLQIPSAEAVFISLGEQIEKSILASLHVKDLGAKAIYVKGISPDHERILKALGVTRVIFPEAEIARQTADHVTWTNALEFFHLDQDHSMLEIGVPSALVGKTLAEAELPRKYGLIVVGIKEALAEKWELMPRPDFRFTDEHLLLVFGRKTD